MNILALDVGNTRVAVGACVGGKVVASRRIGVDRIEAELAGVIAELAGRLDADPAPRAVICSVNPPAADRVEATVAQATGWPVLRIGCEVALPMEVDLDEPETVGADRVVSAAAAFDAVGGPVVVAGFGTALTINCVSGDGKFIGGVICPGLEMSARALHEGTAALPQVRPERVDSPFGRSTVAAIQAGLFYQAAGTVREVVERMADALGQWPHLVLSGGDAELLRGAYEFFDSVVPDLCLLGVNLAYRRHVEKTGVRG